VVSLAHKFAFETPQVKTKAISVVTMPELTRQYKISGTPHTVLNGLTHLRGRVTENQLMTAIRLF
jgi:hypothetical protein